MLNRIIEYLPQMKKSIVAGVATGSTAFGAVQRDGVTWQEWGYVVATGIGAGFLAWVAKNAGTTTQPTAAEPPV